MNTSNRFSLLVVLAAVVAMSLAHALQLSAENVSSSEAKNSTAAQWSVQVDRVDPGEVALASSFQIAIYESLLDEVAKTKRFKQVLRDGDRSAGDVSDLLILKTTVEKYTAGSETRRAVTTVSGATKLTVRSQLCARDGHVVLERTINGNVRFMGGNLRATHNLARNVAKAIKQSSLPDPSRSASAKAAESDHAVVVEFR